MSRKPKAGFEVYQLKTDSKYDIYRNKYSTELEHFGLGINICNYNLVWSGELPARFSWDKASREIIKIFDRILTEHPEDYSGHTPEVSDVIALRLGDDVRFFYTEPIWFSEFKGFLQREKEVENSLSNMAKDACIAASQESLTHTESLIYHDSSR